MFTAKNYGQLKVDISLSAERGVVGDDLVVTCKVTNEKGDSVFVNWRRIFDGHVREIATLAYVHSEFAKDGRYRASYYLPNDDLKLVYFYLNISSKRF